MRVGDVLIPTTSTHFDLSFFNASFLFFSSITTTIEPTTGSEEAVFTCNYCLNWSTFEISSL